VGTTLAQAVARPPRREPLWVRLTPPGLVHSSATRRHAGALVRSLPLPYLAMRPCAMSDSSPSRPSADRNLLFGILALQLDFISRDALLAALRAWVLDKGKPLGRILQDQGQLTPDRLVLLNALVAAHLKGHQNDSRQSLEAVTVPSSVRQQLEDLRDGDLHVSLAVVGSVVPTNPEAIRPPVPKPQDSGPERRY